MSKRNYTHIKELLPTIQTMVAEGMTQREIAEHFGFKDKFVVKEVLKRARKKRPPYRKPEDASRLRHCKNTNMKTSG